MGSLVTEMKHTFCHQKRSGFNIRCVHWVCACMAIHKITSCQTHSITLCQLILIKSVYDSSHNSDFTHTYTDNHHQHSKHDSHDLSMAKVAEIAAWDLKPSKHFENFSLKKQKLTSKRIPVSSSTSLRAHSSHDCCAHTWKQSRISVLFGWCHLWWFIALNNV